MFFFIVLAPCLCSGSVYVLQVKEGEEGAVPEEKAPVTPVVVGAPKGKKPANQFNYSERASQTYNNPLRVGVRAN